MKIKTISLSLSLSLIVAVLLSLVTLKACNPVVDAVEEADWLTEYQQTLRQVLSQATASNQHMNMTEMNQFATNIRQAYIDVLGNQADLEAFERGYERVVNPDVRSKEADTIVQEYIGIITRQSQTPDEAIALLDALLSTHDFDDEERLSVITAREFLVYLQDNGELIDELRTEAGSASSNATPKGVALNLIQNLNEECEEKTIQQFVIDPETRRLELIVVVIMDCPNGGGDGWWDIWGKCAAGIMSGCGTVGLASCLSAAALTAPIGGIGCPGAGAIGCLFGGLGGAVAGC